MHITENMVGREVCTRNGFRGRISQFSKKDTVYPVEVKFYNGMTLSYTVDGKHLLSNITEEDIIWVDSSCADEDKHLSSLEYFRKKMGGII